MLAELNMKKLQKMSAAKDIKTNTDAPEGRVLFELIVQTFVTECFVVDSSNSYLDQFIFLLRERFAYLKYILLRVLLA